MSPADCNFDPYPWMKDGSANGPLWLHLDVESDALPYRHGTYRTTHPRDTLQRFAPLMKDAGITRLADVTGLDWIGVPVYQAVRPLSRNLSVSQGKGLTHLQAKVSAMMEAFELFHAEVFSVPTTCCSVADMRLRISYSPDALPLMEGHRVPDNVPLCWAKGSNLLTRREEWVPKDLCCLDFTLQDRLAHAPFVTTSNGLASGNTYGEAIVHGLYEVIERDATARARMDNAPPHKPLDTSTIRSRTVQGLLHRLHACHVECVLIDVTGPIGIPCFEVELHDQSLYTSVWGSGCHMNATTAMVRAITEACQTRVTYIAGTRDDLRYPDPEIAHSPMPRHPSGPAMALAPLRHRHPVLARLTVGGQIQALAQGIFGLTGAAPIVLDLSLPGLGIPVVYLVAPGLRFDAGHRSLRSSWQRISKP